jgi:hypothetical protein
LVSKPFFTIAGLVATCTGIPAYFFFKRFNT